MTKKKYERCIDYSLKANRITRRNAIIMKCLMCTCNNIDKVNHCRDRMCPLWRWSRGVERGEK